MRDVATIEQALQFAARGWSCFPLHGKRPPTGYLWRDRSTSDAATLAADFRTYSNGAAPNVGLDCGKSGLVVIDLDRKDGRDGPAEWAALKARMGFDDAGALVSQTGGGGLHLVFSAPVGAVIRNGANKLGPGIDVRADGGYIVAPGSLHPETGATYEAIGDWSRIPAELPAALVRLLADGNGRQAAQQKPTAAPAGASKWAEAALADELAGLAGASVGERNDRLNAAAFSLGQIVGGGWLSPGRVEIALSAAAAGLGLGDAETAATIKSGVAAGLAQPRGPKEQTPRSVTTRATPAGGTAEAAPELRILNLTDLGNAERFAKTYAERARYCHAWRAWLVWDGRRWARDLDGQALRWAKGAVRSIYAEAASVADDDQRAAVAKWALRSENLQRVRAMLELAQSEAGIPIAPADLDRDPFLFNCANGTLDLRSGLLHPHDPEDLLTKIAPVPFDPDAQCPLWLAFLDRIFGGNARLIAFIQTALGYTLTADVSEQKLFLQYGTGANGKTVFTRIQSAILGEYAAQTPMATLMAKTGDAIPNDIARLVGARLVTASEAEEGQRLAESLIKQMTGGDTLTARFLHAEFFEFVPTFKLWLASNHKPAIRGTDYAIWRRLLLVPFAVTIPCKEQDPHLAEKLMAELPGILAWAVEGCMMWQAHGLEAPPEVLQATAEYRDEQDQVGAFVAECCVAAEDATARAGELYAAYREWCDRSGERPLSGTMFGRRLTERGYDKVRTKYVRYLGIGLLASEGENG